MKYICAMLVIVALSVLSYAAVSEPQLSDVPVSASHMNTGVTCRDCHLTSLKTAAPEETCRGCHGDRAESKAITFQDTNGKRFTERLHASHLGSIHCSKCHKSHGPSVLYCNEACHLHSFRLKVP